MTVHGDTFLLHRKVIVHQLHAGHDKLDRRHAHVDPAHVVDGDALAHQLLGLVGETRGVVSVATDGVLAGLLEVKHRANVVRLKLVENGVLVDESGGWSLHGEDARCDPL